jgi:hypothetical protein
VNLAHSPRQLFHFVTQTVVELHFVTASLLSVEDGAGPDAYPQHFLKAYRLRA